MNRETYEMTLLFDYYGDLLTDKQKELFDLHYNEDLSLSEIAEHLGISRQGVRDGVIRSEDILKEIEQKLGFVKRHMGLKEVLDGLVGDINQIKELNTNYEVHSLLDDLRIKIENLD